MGRAVIRTVVDPATGESFDIMGFQNAGQLRFERLHPPHNTPRELENRALFGEIASQAFGKKKTGRLPPAAELLQRERPRRELPPAEDSESARKQRYYRSLLGSALPEVQREAVLREAVRLPALAGSPEVRVQVLAEVERKLRDRLLLMRAPYRT